MPVIVAWIGSMLISIVGRMVISALVSVGIGFAVHAIGAHTDVGQIIQAKLMSAGPLWPWIGFFKIDQAMTIVLSALAGREITEAASVYVTQNFNPKLKGAG